MNEIRDDEILNHKITQDYLDFRSDLSDIIENYKECLTPDLIVLELIEWATLIAISCAPKEENAQKLLKDWLEESICNHKESK